MNNLVYVAIDPSDGRVVAATKNNPKSKNRVAETVGEYIRKGLHVCLVSDKLVTITVGKPLQSVETTGNGSQISGRERMKQLYLKCLEERRARA